MRKYQGLTKDPITGEVRTSKNTAMAMRYSTSNQAMDSLYGFVQTKSGIDVERIGAPKNADAIDNVLVVWVARYPEGGTFIVGWYKHATVYRKLQPPPPGSDRVHNVEQIGYIVKAKSADCTLLPVDRRVLRVPRRRSGGMGQSNIWYADQPKNAQFKQTVLRFIDTGVVPVARKQPTKKGHAWQPDPYRRRKVEEKAMDCAPRTGD